MKTVTYARVSSKEQHQEGFSIPAQLRLINDYASNNGHTIVEKFIDVETAKQKGRKDFNLMIEYLKENTDVKGILCEKTDRLARNFYDISTLYDLMHKLDLTLFLVKENATVSKNSISNDKFMFDVKAIMAKNFIDNLSEETKKGLDEKVRQGVFPSRAPIGYKNNSHTKLIELDEAKAMMVRKLFELYATRKYSLQSIAELINRDGLRNYKGKVLYKSSVEKILKNPFYHGKFRWSGKLHSGNYRPIITTDLFDSVQEALDSHNKIKVNKRKFAFSGLMVCGKCGCTITAEIHKAKYIYYRCTGFKGKCGNTYIKEEELEKKFGELVKNITLDKDNLELIKQALIDSHKEEIEYQGKKIKVLNSEYTKLKNRIHQAYNDKIDGKITHEFYEERLKLWEVELKENRREWAKYQDADLNYLTQGTKILELCNKAYSLYLRKDAQEKGKLLRYLLSNCSMINGSLYPAYSKPFDLFAKQAYRTDWGS